MGTTDVKSKVANKSKAFATRAAVHYANVSCPFLTYQPKMSKEVKNLRKK